MGINIEAVKEAIAFPDFQQTALLEIALTHPSYVYENFNLNRQQQDQQELHYRRQAILGDSIFNAAVVDYLVDDRFPNFSQGEITNIKNQIVSRKQHFEFAQKLNLKGLCLLGRGERDREQNEQVELFGEMFEALVGAIYLECKRDFSPVRNWLVEHFIKKAVDNILTATPLGTNQLSEDKIQAISQMNSAQAVESLRMKKLEVDALVAEDSQLQQLLSWIKLKSLSVRSDDKPAKVRAFYLAVVSLLGLPLVRNFDPNRSPAKARQFATSFNRVREVALDLGFNLNPNTDPAYVLISILAQDIDPQLKQTVQQLIAELPNPKEERENFETWRQTKGLEWVAKLTDVLGIDFQLSDKQRELLKRYYSDNKLLLECLNSVSNLTPTLRAEIEEGLFLPID